MLRVSRFLSVLLLVLVTPGFVFADDPKLEVDSRLTELFAETPKTKFPQVTARVSLRATSFELCDQIRKMAIAAGTREVAYMQLLDNWTVVVDGNLEQIDDLMLMASPGLAEIRLRTPDEKFPVLPDKKQIERMVKEFLAQNYNAVPAGSIRESYDTFPHLSGGPIFRTEVSILKGRIGSTGIESCPKELAGLLGVVGTDTAYLFFDQVEATGQWEITGALDSEYDE